MRLLKSFQQVVSSQSVIELLRLFSAIYVTRKLLADDYAVFANITVYTGFSILVVNFPISIIIVQNRNLDEEGIDKLFWLALIIPCLLSLYFFSLALVSLNDANLSSVYLSASLIPITAAIATLYRAKVERQRLFGISSKARLTSGILGSSVSILLAHLGLGTLTLVYGMITLNLSEWFFYFIKTKWRPKFYLGFHSLKEQLNFARAVFMERIFGHFVETFDKILLINVSNSTNLGLYYRAQSILTIPLRTVAQSAASVLLPNLTQIRDRERIKVVLSALVLLTQIYMFGVIPFIIFCEEIVYLFFGVNWIDLTLYLPPFALSGIGFSINALLNSYILARGDSQMINRLTIIEKPVMFLLLIVGYIILGPIGIAYAWMVQSIIGVILRMYLLLPKFRPNGSLAQKGVASLLITNTISLSIYLILWDITQDVYSSICFGMVLAIATIAIMWKGRYGMLGFFKKLQIV